MRIAREKYPQHFTMILLGFVTRLRPSSMRPLRLKGPEQDIDSSTGLLYVRRSRSRRQDIMNRTKTGRQQVIAPSRDAEGTRVTPPIGTVRS